MSYGVTVEYALRKLLKWWFIASLVSLAVGVLSGRIPLLVLLLVWIGCSAVLWGIVGALYLYMRHQTHLLWMRYKAQQHPPTQ